MNINASLLGQMITFAIFIWFTMKYVWPPLTKALEERQQKIADGLAAAERGHHELELAQGRATEQLKEAKQQAQQIIEKAKHQAGVVIDEAKQKAKDEGLRLIESAKQEIDKEREQAKQALRQQLASLAIAGAERILAKQVDEASNAALLNDLVEQL